MSTGAGSSSWSLSSLAPDADETKQAAEVMRNLSDLASAIDGVGLLVHHPGHANQTRTRGGYQFEANADEVLVMAAVEDSRVAHLTAKKVKEGESGRVMWLRVQSVERSLVLATADPKDAMMPTRERVLVLLTGAAQEGMTGPQLRDALGLDPTQRSTLTDALRVLRDEGLVVSRGHSQTTRHYVTECAPPERGGRP